MYLTLLPLLYLPEVRPVGLLGPVDGDLDVLDVVLGAEGVDVVVGGVQQGAGKQIPFHGFF